MVKKEKKSLFSSGILATAAIQTSLEQEEIQQRDEIPQAERQQPGNEEDDPLFGNTQRIREITQRAIGITDASGYPEIAIEKLDDNPYQPRKRMNAERLEAFAHEIQHYGFKGVLLARTHPFDSQRFQLVYGHRRREASKIAGLTHLPVMIDDTIKDDEMKFLAINENLLRDNLTPIDEAYTYTLMLEEMSQEAIAARLGVSRGYIRNRLDILKAPANVQDMVEEKPDTMKAVVYLKDIEEDDIRTIAIQSLMDEKITINQIKAFIENLRKAKIPTENKTAKEEKTSTPSISKQKDHSLQEDVQEKETSSEVIHPDQTEKKDTTKSEAAIIQQSKEQTEAATDKTKIETFTKYLSKYEIRLNNRQITSDERAMLDSMVSMIKHILETHS